MSLIDDDAERQRFTATLLTIDIILERLNIQIASAITTQPFAPWHVLQSLVEANVHIELARYDLQQAQQRILSIT